MCAVCHSNAAAASATFSFHSILERPHTCEQAPSQHQQIRIEESMKRTTAILAIALAVTVLTSTMSPVVFAQQPARGDWTAVQSVAIDESLSIRLKDGKKVRGKFSSANDSELT